MDPRFDEMFDDPFNKVFKVVFYPDRVYHAAYLNATRSSRYRYNVREVRNAFDITVLKAEMYVDGVFLGNVLRVEYRAGRLTEVARERNRFLRDRVLMQIRLLTSDPAAPPAGPSAMLYLHYDKWINAYQTEIWETVTLPPGKHHDFKVLDQIGRMGPITSVAAFKELLHDLKGIRRLELSFRENDVDLPFGYSIGNPQWDNNFIRNHQVPNTQDPSSDRNTVDDFNYLIDFQRGYFFDNIDDVPPVRYRNGMMEPENKEARN